MPVAKTPLQMQGRWPLRVSDAESGHLTTGVAIDLSRQRELQLRESRHGGAERIPEGVTASVLVSLAVEYVRLTNRSHEYSPDTAVVSIWIVLPERAHSTRWTSSKPTAL